jgi:hypothetical protein
MSLEVQDIDSALKELKSRGVKFEDYDTPEIKTIDGVAQFGELKAAWFKDSEGNLLAIGNPVPVTAAART